MLHCHVPPILKFNSALLHAGFQVSMTHCRDNAVKTNAPPSVVWDVMREWVKLNPVGEKHRDVTKTSGKMLAIETVTPNIRFDLHADANPPSRQVKLVRYEEHRGMNWGPQQRAKKRKVEDAE